MGAAADEIDKYLDAGFERQTMSYISGNRKNAVEMQFSNCKANVKKEELDEETKAREKNSRYIGSLLRDVSAVFLCKNETVRFLNRVTPDLRLTNQKPVFKLHLRF